MFSPNDLGLMIFALVGSAGLVIGFLFGYLIRDYFADKALSLLETRTRRIEDRQKGRDVSR